MTKSCRHCSSDFEVTEGDLIFYDKISPVFGGKKYQIPPPTLCSECRTQRRLSFWNIRNLYWRIQPDGKPLLSIYSPQSNIPVLNNQVWFSDAWDAKNHARDFDFSRPFFHQFHELQRAIPHWTLNAAYNENCDYCSYAGWNKDCYLLYDSDHNRDGLYGQHNFHNVDCTDCDYAENSELCYHCVRIEKCYDSRFLQDCTDCSTSAFLKSCIGCVYCFGCAHLRNKRYCFFNTQLSKEEYFQKITTVEPGSYSKTMELAEASFRFFRTLPVKYLHGAQNENVQGNYIDTSKDIKDCFDISNSRDCAYLYDCFNCKDSYDVNGWGGFPGSELLYEGLTIGEGAYHICFSNSVFMNISEVLYSEVCFNGSHHLFGCVGLKHAQYCILNKQYTKEEYETLVPKIIEHMMKTPLTPPLTRGEIGGYEWGEFFPPRLSPFGYNETVAQEYFPLTKEEALKKGFNWSDYVPPPPQVEKIIPASKLPDHIKDVPDDILNWAIECEVTKKPFKIIKPELKFYREHNIPIPRRHPDQRHRDRMALRNPRKLWTRQCDCKNEEHHHAVEAHCNAPLRDMNNVQQSSTHRCPHTFQTTYSPERKEIVYCEECYLKEVY